MKKDKISSNADGLPASLPKPAVRALNAAGYKSLENLKNFNEAELLKLHGVGPKAIRILRQYLDAKK